MSSNLTRISGMRDVYSTASPVVLNAHVALSLAQLGAVRVHYERQVTELRRRPPERPAM